METKIWVGYETNENPKVHGKPLIVQYIHRLVTYVFAVYLINCPLIINTMKHITKYQES